ncbi:RNA polymerase sigma factor [Pseudoalteromonas sp. T1lg23B]|uniref:RNA polymerase sigma factor n=1 Tax=Pseudoalteromonas sp. T1lg23B TaxID=2077097 RepID=UPI000CF60FA4|nr:RNA polymerase sigma factor [Pseudoalteromonas sp. T1lg23B]
MLIALKSWLNNNEMAYDALYAYKQSGDSKYLEQLIDSYSQDLYYFLCSQGCAALAQDLCQKTWLITMEKKHLYHQQQSPKAWLFTVARNAMIDELRKQQRFISTDDVSLLTSPPVVHEHTSLTQAIEQLPFLQREALSLQLEGFTLQEIADITHSNLETIKTRLRYAKQQLKNAIGETHE